MKTPDEFKKNLFACMDEAIDVAENGDAHDLLDFAHHAQARMSETYTYIQQLEAELETVKRERDAAVTALESIATGRESRCAHCAHKSDRDCFICWGTRWQWCGVCPENTEVNPNA